MAQRVIDRGEIRTTTCQEVPTMRIVSKIALAAVLAAAAASPAMAQWGGGYAYVDDGWYGGYAYAGPYPYRTYSYGYAAPYAYGGAYAYAGEPYYGRSYGPRYRYRYAPATSDYYHNSRQLQGTR